jgi:hypothetical protein
VLGPGLGPVAAEELVLDAAQRAGEDLAAHGVEHPVEEPRALEARRQVHSSRLVEGGSLVLDPVGVGGLAPVGHDPGEGAGVKGGGVADELGLVLGQRSRGDLVPGPGQHLHRRGADVARQPGAPGNRQVIHRPAQVGPEARRALGQLAPRRQPRSGRPRPIGPPFAAAPERTAGPGRHRLEPRELPVEGDHGVAVGNGGRLGRHEGVDHCRQLLEGITIGAHRAGPADEGTSEGPGARALRPGTGTIVEHTFVRNPTSRSSSTRHHPR